MSLATASRNWVSSGMLEYLVVVLVGLIAFAGGQWWVIPIGALGMSIGPWFNQWKMLKEHPLVPFDSKVVQFFGAVYGNGLIACGGSYIIGILGGSFWVEQFTAFPVRLPPRLRLNLHPIAFP